ncbi:MAG: histidine phosphatase family protein [Pseudomonadota bacterium]
MKKVTLAFLRHAKVPSHKGDMPLTADSGADIQAAIPKLRAMIGQGDDVLFLATRTQRSQQTAVALRDAIAPEAPEILPAWGLRNPDLYLAGSRVEMGSTPEFLASQCEHLSLPRDAAAEHPFFGAFLTAPDRIEYWLNHETPPGENAAAVAKRVLQFAESFLDMPSHNDLVVACVTHSPVMRAILTKGLNLSDPGEPGWVEAIVIEVTRGGMTFRFRDHFGAVQHA